MHNLFEFFTSIDTILSNSIILNNSFLLFYSNNALTFTVQLHLVVLIRFHLSIFNMFKDVTSKEMMIKILKDSFINYLQSTQIPAYPNSNLLEPFSGFSICMKG